MEANKGSGHALSQEESSLLQQISLKVKITKELLFSEDIRRNYILLSENSKKSL